MTPAGVPRQQSNDIRIDDDGPLIRVQTQEGRGTVVADARKVSKLPLCRGDEFILASEGSGKFMQTGGSPAKTQRRDEVLKLGEREDSQSRWRRKSADDFDPDRRYLFSLGAHKHYLSQELLPERDILAPPGIVGPMRSTPPQDRFTHGRDIGWGQAVGPVHTASRWCRAHVQVALRSGQPVAAALRYPPGYIDWFAALQRSSCPGRFGGGPLPVRLGCGTAWDPGE